MSDCPRCNQPEQYGCGCTAQEMNDWRADEIAGLTAQLATARRDAWQTVLDNIREWAWPEDGTYPPEQHAIQSADRGTVEFIEGEIRALIDKDATP